MNFRALSLGVVLGFLTAIVPSCGTPPCTPQNCGGCCDAMNKCVPASAASSNTSCGSKGASCANCAANGQVCNATSFICEPGGGTGGGTTGGGTTGGGTTGGGTTGGGTTGGGTTGGGTTGGGTTGGGTGGGTTGGGTGTPCSVMSQNCMAGEACIYIDQSGNGRCFAGTCDVVSQNCPTATDKCTYTQFADAGVGRACVPAGAATQGQACGPMADNCGKGLVCVGGKCEKFCYTDTNCGGGQNICGSLVTIPGSPELPSTCITLAGCDPLTQNCPAGQGCYLTQAGPACIPVGAAMNGQTCGSMTNCVKGSTCIGPSLQMLSCHSFCNLDGGAPGCTGSTCGFLVDQSMNRLAWGACQ